MAMDITGRKLFVKALLEEGVDTVFGYPGGMVTDIMDELYKHEEIELVLPRHEQGLIHEAEGYARATGRTGVCSNQRSRSNQYYYRTGRCPL